MLSLKLKGSVQLFAVTVLYRRCGVKKTGLFFVPTPQSFR